MCGESWGIGVLAASGAENCTLIWAAPLTPLAPVAGVIDSTLIGTAGASCFSAAAACAGVTGAAWLPGESNATTATPAASTIAALVAVRARPRRRFNRDPPGSAAAVPSVSSPSWRLRNHQDRATAQSLHEISQSDNSRKPNFRTKQDRLTTPPTHRRASVPKGCRPAAVSARQINRPGRANPALRDQANTRRASLRPGQMPTAGGRRPQLARLLTRIAATAGSRPPGVGPSARPPEPPRPPRANPYETA